MEIKQLLTTVNRTAMSSRSIKYIVVHYVGAVSTALANAKYFQSTYRGASSHYFVDDTSIYQSVLDKDKAWSVGGTVYANTPHPLNKIATNSNTLNIEMCCVRNAAGSIAISDKTIENTQALIAQKMKEYNIPLANVIRHYDVTGKSCPNANGLLAEAQWLGFKNGINGTTVTPTVAQAPNTATTSTIAFNAFDKVCQANLKVMGYVGADGKPLVVDGKKGTNTKFAIKAFQKDMRLAETGDVVGETRKAMDQIMSRPLLKYGSRGYAVRYVQKRVGASVDGIFGSGTLAKVKAYQKAHGLSPDGVVGAKTWASLL